VAGFQAGGGERIITELAPAAPELSSLAMVGTGPAGLTGLTGHAASIKGLKRGGVLAALSLLLVGRPRQKVRGCASLLIHEMK
jgi:hypothetical protein